MARDSSTKVSKREQSKRSNKNNDASSKGRRMKNQTVIIL